MKPTDLSPRNDDVSSQDSSLGNEVSAHCLIYTFFDSDAENYFRECED